MNWATQEESYHKTMTKSDYYPKKWWSRHFWKSAALREYTRLSLKISLNFQLCPLSFSLLFPCFPSPRLRVYPRYTVVTKKLDAIISLGIANSRVKDYFDLWVTIVYCRQKDHLLPFKEAMHCWSDSGSCSAKADVWVKLVTGSRNRSSEMLCAKYAG